MRTSKVKRVTSIGERHVYDIEVDKVHNYFASGVNVHNCEYNKFLTRQSNILGEELFAIKDTFFRYRHRNFVGSPAGPDKRKLRGLTRVLGSCDEIGWMLAAQQGTIKYDVEEIYKAMNNSFASAAIGWRRMIDRGYYNIPAPLFANISSPSSKRDKIMSLVEESKTSKTLIGFHMATWEVHPVLTRESDFMADLERRTPDAFWRDFGAVPPLSASPFVGDKAFLEPLIGKVKNGTFIRPRQFTSKSGQQQLSGVLGTNWIDQQTPRLMTIDAGMVNNCFAVTIQHVDKATDRIVYDVMDELIPIGKDCPISFTALQEDILGPMIEAYNVRMVVADRWQSSKLLTDLAEEYGVRTEVYSLKYEDFEVFRQGILDSSFTIPQAEVSIDKVETLGGSAEYPQCFNRKPVAHFLLQCLTVRDMVGKGVEKGDGLTDDVFRAAVLGHAYLSDALFRKDFTAFTAARNTSRALAAGANRLGATPGGQVNSRVGALAAGKMGSSVGQRLGVLTSTGGPALGVVVK